MPSASIRYSLNDGSSTEELRVNTITVPAGGEQVQQLTWRVDRAGALSLLVEVDPEALIPEKDESNNAAQFFQSGCCRLAPTCQSIIAIS